VDTPGSHTHEVKKLSNTTRIFGALAVLALVMGIIFAAEYLWKKNNSDADPVADETWNVYENADYDFSLRIPKNLGAYTVASTTPITKTADGTEYSYNQLLFTFTGQSAESASAVPTTVTIGIVSTANWEQQRDAWTLIGARDSTIFAARYAGGDEDFKNTANEIFSSFAFNQAD
jgi:hypothetical protein